MAKPTRYAPHICTGVTIVAVIGIILGLVYSSAIITVILLLPAAFYQAYRTEGKSTKASSILLVAVLILEIFLILFGANFNLAEYLGATQKSIGGYLVPLGDVKVVGPSIVGVLSIILFARTRGIYTRWLAVTILVTALAIIYILDQEVFHHMLKLAVDEGMRRI
jgi:hypothetical protein